MNGKRLALSCIVVFIFIFLSDWLIHGKLLMGIYQETSTLWRPQDEMRAMMPWMTAAQLLLSVVFCLIFVKGYENRGIAEGIRYGILMGLLFIPQNLITYAVQPLPGKLIGAWIAAGFIQAIIAGILVAALYKPKQA